MRVRALRIIVRRCSYHWLDPLRSRLEQVKGLYKGLSPPLALTGFTNAVMFAINSQMKKIVASFKRDPTSSLTLPQVRGSAQLHPSCKLTRVFRTVYTDHRRR